ncbi:hypothetical protein S40285_02993 [Stachybotrys chlorohalonatus IBT 40285]|uniref:Nucleoporin NDC1 n=1 Tax=Stachybotrys chlorohalonatus (strain IBT 40285) TaxID=1283841 RepID=A0A084QSZ5_STAC4|nr:hypothetical protein S40285_02993 [Stachybotrys chlorohalonata IBT 40285]
MAVTVARRAPYKDFLQPALHRRFTSTATVLLAVAYIEALILAQWSSYLWAWFPLGSAGFRTLAIFFSGLPILILRIAQYHVGKRTGASGWQTLKEAFTSLQAYETIISYGSSSIMFGLVYLWSTSEASGMKWISYYSVDRARLNERPLYFMCYLTICAFLQVAAHLHLDYDRLDLGLAKKQKEEVSGSLTNSLKIASLRLPSLLTDCLVRSVIAIPITHTVYLVFLRSLVWGWTLTFFRPFYNLSKSNILPSFAGWSIPLLARCVFAGTLLCFTWAVANTAFSIFMIKDPLKHGKPLTSESKDPNGSLLNGLKSKKLSVKCFALWELALIAQNFDVRRQAIFDDIDRKDGPMWAQVYAICIGVLKSIEIRVDEYGKPAPIAAAEPIPEEPRKRVSAPLRDDPIFTNGGSARGGAAKSLEQVARAPGTTTPAARLSPVVKRTWANAKDQVLSKEQQEAMSPEHLRGQANQWAIGLMQVPAMAALFQRQFRNEFAGTVLGTPHGEPLLYINAATTLSELAVRSLTDDKFGQVHRDVPTIVRTLTSVIEKTETLKLKYPTHWTDTTGNRECPEVDEVLDAVRNSLAQVVAKFEPYSNDLRLSSADIRYAKEAMVKPQPQEKEPEQQQIQEKKKEPEQKKIRAREHKRFEMEQVR